MDLVAVGPPDEALLLDLLNTTPVVDGAPRDDLADSASAKAWMRERGVTPTKAEMAALVEARSILQKVVRGEVGPKALRQFLETVRLRPVAGADGFDWRLDVEGTPITGPGNIYYQFVLPINREGLKSAATTQTVGLNH